MEISKGLQLEIQSVQSKLKNAIRDHQICVGKLKDDPNNPDILDRIQEIQLHIVSLGRCQKQVVQRLRKEVDDFKAVNANDVKVSVTSLLGLNNNNHITTNNESRNKDTSGVRVVSNGLDSVRLTGAKEDYEDIVRNGDVPSLRESSLKKERSISVETLSADDEEIVEVSVEDAIRENERRMSEEPLDERKMKCSEQLSFLQVLGLITTLRSAELQKRKAERKRRSTANPQFVHSNWDVPTKRKRHNYLQSAGNVPQTRQTTARLNGPSPPPLNKSTIAMIVPPKSTSPPTCTLSKSLIPTQKATTRPNILRSMSESRVFPNKSIKIENESRHLPLTCTTTKTSQSTINTKTVHIPGLPSGLTIERIENDSAVCINCRNPGTLTNCDNCEANYHVSCHTISPPPPRLCPKCALKTVEASITIKKNDELAAASYAPGVAGKGGENPEIDKASRRFYKIGTNARHQIIATGRCINKLSGSTFLIPITPNSIATAISIPKSGRNVGAIGESKLSVVKSADDSSWRHADPGSLSYSTTIVVNNQFSRSNVTYVPQSDPNSIAYSYKLPIYDSELDKSRIDKSRIDTPRIDTSRIDTPRIDTSRIDTWRIDKSRIDKSRIDKSRIDNEREEGRESEKCSNVDESRSREGGRITGSEAIAGFSDERKQDFTVSKSIDHSANEQQRRFDNFTGRFGESIARGWKKSSTTRALPGLTRIVKSIDKKQPIASDHGNNDDVDELQKFSYNGESPAMPVEGQKERSRDAGKRDKSREENDNDGRCGRTSAESEITGDRKNEKQAESLFSRGKYKSKSGKQFHSLFASYNKPDTLADCLEQSELSREGTSRKITDDAGTSNAREFTRSDETGSRSDSSENKSSTEHVKLEEAHLSAPPRAKLMNRNNDVATARNDFSCKIETLNRHLPNRRRTTEDRATIFHSRDFYDDAKFERRQTPRILMRSERKSLDSGRAFVVENITNNTGATDLSFFQKNSSDSFAGSQREEQKLPEIDYRSESDSSATEDASSPRSVLDRSSKDINPLDDDKNTEERRESNGGDNERNENVYGCESLEVDEETEDNEEDVEDDEDQDCPIVDEEIKGGGIEELRISTVSPESMKVLEQFETAMMQAENLHQTADP